MQSPVKEGVRKSGPATAPTKAKGAKKVSGSDTLPNSLAEDDMDLPAFMRPPGQQVCPRVFQEALSIAFPSGAYLVLGGCIP